VKKYVLIPLLIFPVMIFASSNSAFLALYNSGLNQQMPAYQSATIQLVQAQNALYSLTSIFVPTLSLTTQAAGVTLDASGFVAENPSLDVNLGMLNLYSTQIGFALPLNLKSLNFNAPELSISRNLIVEDQVNIMQAKYAYSNALWSVQNAQWSYMITLAQNIFNWHYYNEMVSTYSQEVNTLQNIYNSISPLNQTQQNTAYQQLLAAQSSLANYKNSLETIPPLPNYTPYSTEVYNEALSYVSSMTSNLSTNVNINDVVSKRADVKALEYQYESYKDAANLWFSPFIPNPTITFTVPLNNLSGWQISIGLNFQLLNGGVNVIQSQQILTNVQVGQETLQNATTTDISALKGLFLKQKALQISLTTAQNNVQTALQNFQTAQALYQKGLESFDDYMLANLSYQQALIGEENVQQQILVNEIQIMQTEGLPLGGEGI